MERVDPLVRGIYYMFLTTPHPARTILDKEASDCIHDVMRLHRVPLYSSVVTVQQMLVKELLRRQELISHRGEL